MVLQWHTNSKKVLRSFNIESSFKRIAPPVLTVATQKYETHRRMISAQKYDTADEVALSSTESSFSNRTTGASGGPHINISPFRICQHIDQPPGNTKLHTALRAKRVVPALYKFLLNKKSVALVVKSEPHMLYEGSVMFI